MPPASPLASVPATPPATATAPSSTPASTPPSGAWARLVVPPFSPQADLIPSTTSTSGVALASTFTLTSRTTVPAADLVKGLEISPATAFTSAPGARPSSVVIQPTDRLAPGVSYRFSLTDPTGALLGTWAYQAEQPLHVVTLLPGDRTSNVPTDTGIEVTFDQDGVLDFASHFSIEPAITGTFKAVGRTMVFVPNQRLAVATVYRVTISAGVRMSGSAQTLEEPVTFAFETGGGASKEAWDVGIGRPILEAATGEPPVIALDILANGDSPWPASIPIQAYRLPTIEVARAAAERLLAENRWATYDSASLVSTVGLTRVLDTKIEPTRSQPGYGVLRLPSPLAEGWYLIVVPRDGRDRQALLQVTDLTAWAMTSDTRTLAWVHDLATGDPIDGAALVDPAGVTVGTTATGGLLDLATPASLVPDAARGWSDTATLATVVAPDGRRLLLALGLAPNSSAYAWERNGSSLASEPSQRWWLLASTDRSAYRPTDTVHAWGLVRDRDDGSVPSPIEIRLRATDASDTTGPWLSRKQVAPSIRGTWTADLGIAGLPYGDYSVDVVVGGTIASSMWISVEDIRKPAYQLDVTAAHRAAIEGDKIAVTGVASYFDGTVVPGIKLRAEGLGQSLSGTTDASGTVRYALTARMGDRIDMWYDTIGLAPVDAEEGQISGSATVVVFPSDVWLQGSVAIKANRVELAGTVSHVDLAEVERQLASVGWVEDPTGAPFAGRSVSVRVVELVPVARQTGTTYDFIEKRAVPVMEYTTTEHAIGTYTTTAGSDGRVALSIGIPDPKHEYRLTLTTRDAAGRLATLVLTASPGGPLGAYPSGAVQPYLDRPHTCGIDSRQTALGTPVTLTMYDGDGTPSSGEHLFIVASRGIRQAVIQGSPSFTQAFDAGDLPSLEILVVRFGAGGYVVTQPVQLRAQPDQRAISVTLSTDKARYAPGDTATIQVRTAGPDGTPVAADVVLRGVDEKIYAMGGAADIDALATLLTPTGNGLLQSATTHVVPLNGMGGGCGDTGGGREDFRDTILFRLISTGADGRATASVPLPDDITSWHVSATALDAELRAGDGFVLVPVGLPFLADVVLAPEYLTGEHPVLRVRSAGSDLTSGERVRYTIAAPSLLMSATTVEADAFGVASIPLPVVTRGSHAISIEAAVVGQPSLKDSLVRRISVRDSRLEVASTVAVEGATAASVGGPGLTTFVVTDAGRGALLPGTWNLALGGGARFDRAMAAQVARQLLLDAWSVDPATLPPTSFDISAWQRSGIALLPYSSPDLELSALAAIVAPDFVDRQEVDPIFDAALTNGKTTDERRIVALAGRAGLGQDVLGALRGIDPAGLAPRSALWLALGLLAAGDENAARTIERDLLTKHGQELGPWVRLSVGVSVDETVEASALLAIVAAGTGDPNAARVLRYVQDNPVKTFLPVLHEAGAISRLVERLPRTAARFAWTVDGVRHEEALEPGATRSIVVSAAQRAGLSIQPLAGSIAVVATWSGPPAAGDLPSGDLVRISRTVTPAGSTDASSIVRVTLKLDFSPTAPAGCYDVTDRTPSGLVPLVAAAGWGDDTPAVGRPWLVQGQRVEWCVDPANGRQPTLEYRARVVSPGTYTWEPAVVQLGVAPDSGAATSSLSYSIR